MTIVAIAGVKGGCGKTTTALGLAEAVGRTGASALAVDADRQLPNLHVMAGTDRTPMLEAVCADDEEPGANADAMSDVDVDVDRSQDANTAPFAGAQRSPRAGNVGIVSAPPTDAAIDLESAIGCLDDDGWGTVFVDCPSGAGPELVDPLSAADGAVVVTTGTERSVVAAETTVDVARRLDVPILGVVCSRCDAIPPGLEARLGVEVLGAIPEVEESSPLTADAATDAFDHVVERLERSGLATFGNADRGRLPIGVDAVDRALGGGVPAGSVVTLTAPPASQVEHLLYGVTAVRGTLYLATDRSKAQVERAIRRTPRRTGTPTIRSLAGERVEDDLDRVLELLEKLPEGATVIVDVVDALERADRRPYREFLSSVVERVVETESVVVLYGLRDGHEPRNRRLTVQVSDVVFEVPSPNRGGAVGTDPRVRVSKCRFGRTIAEPATGKRGSLEEPTAAGNEGEPVESD
ncbi:AAA family ATPase [Saliphagus sp. GCM10025334]